MIKPLLSKPAMPYSPPVINPPSVRPYQSPSSPTSQADTNPRLTMVDSPKGVLMRVGINRNTTRRATAPPSVIAAIAGDKQ
jgi:hypothetical protein